MKALTILGYGAEAHMQSAKFGRAGRAAPWPNFLGGAGRTTAHQPWAEERLWDGLQGGRARPLRTAPQRQRRQRQRRHSAPATRPPAAGSRPGVDPLREGSWNVPLMVIPAGLHACMPVSRPTGDDGHQALIPFSRLEWSSTWRRCLPKGDARIKPRRRRQEGEVAAGHAPCCAVGSGVGDPAGGRGGCRTSCCAAGRGLFWRGAAAGPSDGRLRFRRWRCGCRRFFISRPSSSSGDTTLEHSRRARERELLPKTERLV